MNCLSEPNISILNGSQRQGVWCRVPRVETTHALSLQTFERNIRYKRIKIRFLCDDDFSSNSDCVALRVMTGRKVRVLLCCLLSYPNF
jgi:hypothetical protein